MRESARSLLRCAVAVYDAPDGALAVAARQAARGGFAGGAGWMRLAMERLRGVPIARPATANFTVLGTVKYGAASAVAIVWAAAAVALDVPALAAFSVPLFYAVEAQAVFLFPVALDGDPRPFRAARALTVRAGGTLRVMAVVVPVAATMLVGGFVGRGFLRSWCLGCLAVCIWHDGLRAADAARTPSA